MEKINTTWHFVWSEINRLVKQISVDRRCPEMVIGISRGGLIPAAMIARQMNLPLVSMEAGEDLAQFGQHGTCCLIVDDIFDTGKTITDLWITDQYEQHIYCCLYNKNISHPEMKQPDYAIDVHTDKWVVFPWESEDDV